MRPTLLALLLAAPFASPASGVAAQAIVDVAPDAPVRGEPVRVTFSAPADSVRVIYRPGAISADTAYFTPTAATFEFVPARAGVVAVAAGGTSQNLSVRFQRAPGAGIAVMVLAGLILFGGAIGSLRMLMSSDLEVDPTFRPDT